MTRPRANSDTGRSVALVCVLIGIGLIAACLINPRGVYEPWELTFGICLVFLLGSAGALAYLRARNPATKSDD